MAKYKVLTPLPHFGLVRSQAWTLFDLFYNKLVLLEEVPKPFHTNRLRSLRRLRGSKGRVGLVDLMYVVGHDSCDAALYYAWTALLVLCKAVMRTLLNRTTSLLN